MSSEGSDLQRVKMRVPRALLSMVLGLVSAAGCADDAAGDPSASRGAALTTRAPLTSTAPPRGVRVDLGGQVHRARGLVRQPDGSYRAICADAPEGSWRAREGTGR